MLDYPASNLVMWHQYITNVLSYLRGFCVVLYLPVSTTQVVFCIDNQTWQFMRAPVSHSVVTE
jgi:hypothetical protein